MNVQKIKRTTKNQKMENKQNNLKYKTIISKARHTI